VHYKINNEFGGTTMNLIIPEKLNPGDQVAIVSLSWGGAGDEELLWRYHVAKKRLIDEFGLKVKEMPNALKGTDYLYQHPEKRAQDLMDAFRDPSVKAIFSLIGGDDTVRLLPYIDFDVIKNHPKIFLGYSDTTVNHFMCLKAGLRSYYGPAVLVEFAENIKMHDYTKEAIKRTLFSNEVIGEIKPALEWTSEHIPWTEKNKLTKRTLKPNAGPICLQGTSKVRGHLIGGCIDVLEMIKGTSLWPNLDVFKDAILFFESSEEKPEPKYIKYWLRNYGAMGIFDQINGIIFGKPFDEQYMKEYQEEIRSVVAGEYNKENLPILFNLNFGHTAPMFIIPYGAQAEIDCMQKTFKILENAVK
jgi:muramoyltetrapeptide carboxypeptidase LdcA involved in peptidoglycan recycling